MEDRKLAEEEVMNGNDEIESGNYAQAKVHFTRAIGERNRI